MRAGEGMVEVTGGRVWYEVVGSGDAIVFEESSHMCHLEQRERYNQVFRGFPSEVEGERAR